MGYIKEPKNVDFIINSEPLTERERIMISELIAIYKKDGIPSVRICSAAEVSMSVCNATFPVSTL